MRAEAIGRAVRAAAVAAEHDDKSRELYEQLVEVENLIGGFRARDSLLSGQSFL